MRQQVFHKSARNAAPSMCGMYEQRCDPAGMARLEKFVCKQPGHPHQLGSVDRESAEEKITGSGPFQCLFDEKTLDCPLFLSGDHEFVGVNRQRKLTQLPEIAPVFSRE